MVANRCAEEKRQEMVVGSESGPSVGAPSTPQSRVVISRLGPSVSLNLEPTRTGQRGMDDEGPGTRSEENGKEQRGFDELKMSNLVY